MVKHTPCLAATAAMAMAVFWVSAPFATGTRAAELFKDKTLTMVVNYGAGGNVDTEARIFQRHLPQHLAGKPTIIIQNVPGAGGLTAINQMGLGIGIKEPSLTFGFMTFNAIAPVIDDPTLKVKMDRFPLIASIGQWYAAYARKDILPGKQQPADIANAKGVFAAGYARSSNHDIRLRIMFELMGTGYKVVTGFQSVGDINKAIAQGEINFMLSTLPGYETQAMPQLIEPGIAIPLWQLGATGKKPGEIVGSEDLKRRGVRFFEEVYEEAHGKKPSGTKYEALVLTSDSSSRLARVIMMPPGAATESIAELRKAFEALPSDAEFVAEYEKIIRMKPIMFNGEETERSFKAATTNVSGPVKAVLKEAAGVE